MGMIQIIISMFYHYSFSEFFKTLCDSDVTGKHPRPKDLKLARNLLIPKRGSIYDYVYMRKNYGAWTKWENLVENEAIGEKAQVSCQENDPLNFVHFVKNFILRLV